MLLVDVHAHMDHDKFKPDLDEVLKRAESAGVKAIITNGVNTPSNRIVLELAKKYPIIKPALGLYPIDALGIPIPALDEVGLARQKVPIDVDAEIEFIEKQKKVIIGIGEVGLDFKHIKDEKLVKKEKENFQKIIDLAERIKKPLIVHSRNAELQVIEMLESSKAKKVLMHCFSGSKKLISRGADNGYYFSIPPVINRLEHFKMLVSMVNINQLLTETDSPWLSLAPGTRNEPANVAETVKIIAQIKNFTVEETANNIFLNYKTLFE